MPPYQRPQSNRATTKGRKTITQAKQQAKKNPLTRLIEQWCNRLLGAVSTRTLAGQEEAYAAGLTKRDYVCNTIGIAAWGMVFPLLTIVVTQLVGVHLAGMFSLAFVTGSLLMIIANYGVRTFQVSDLNEAYSFSDYQLNRWITCAFMVVVGILYCMVRGYEQEMFTISLGVYVYKMIDGLADVYEGRLQQLDKLYLAGISQAFRSVLVLVVFSLLLFITHNLSVSCVAMAIAAFVSFLFLTFPLALFETPKSKRASVNNVKQLFKHCFPLFVALFMYSLIDNMPKFVMEGVLSYDNQLYFNALYFPAQMILLSIGLVYKPLLVRMAEAWADPAKHKRFDLSICAIMAVIVVLTLVVALIMAWIGIPLMSFMYGLDFEPFRGLCFIMLAAGGVTAAIDFLYQVITVLRRQKDVTRLYIITFGFSVFVPILLINFTGLPGAVIGYLIVMCILLVLLVSEYISIRMNFEKDGGGSASRSGGSGSRETSLPNTEHKPLHITVNPSSGDPTANSATGSTASASIHETSLAKKRPSEMRAERERRAQVRAKWENQARAVGAHGTQTRSGGKHERP